MNGEFTYFRINKGAGLQPANREGKNEMTDWHPIETAPKDGTEILLDGGELADDSGSPGFGGVYLCYWSERDGGIWRIKAGFGEIAECKYPARWALIPERGAAMGESDG